MGGIARRGIYDNMKTAVDKVKKGKSRTVNKRFGDLEEALALGADTVLLHELLDPLLAYADAARQQFLPRPRPAIAAVRLSVDCLDVHQQRIVSQVAPLGCAGAAHKVLVIPGHAGL